MPIQILPPQLANQIAAGEVVERPASVVKELVENSLDAGATHIEVDIEKGGSKLIRVRDNGSGIAEQELVLALSRHATSKIKNLDDLEAICSLGFRGEALASISSVSRLTLTSRTAEQTAAWQASAEGRDMQVDVRPAAHPVGTSIEVLDLFFNTPARRKFLRTDKTEFGHIDELIKRLALSRYDVSWQLNHNGQSVRRLKAATTAEQQQKRVAQLCGKAFSEHAAFIENQYGSVRIWGWIVEPSACSSQLQCQYSYVNGRMMRDKLLNHAIRQAYGDLLQADQQPAFVLYLELEPTQVDVNVHPAKHEVRFHQARLIHDFVVSALSDALQQLTVAVPNLPPPIMCDAYQVQEAATSYPQHHVAAGAKSDTATGSQSGSAYQPKHAYTGYSQTGAARYGRQSGATGAAQINRDLAYWQQRQHAVSIDSDVNTAASAIAAAESLPSQAGAGQPVTQVADTISVPNTGVVNHLVAQNRYWLQPSGQGIVVIDLVPTLSAYFAQYPSAAEAILLPQRIDVSARQLQLLTRLAAQFSQAGFDLLLNDNTVIVRKVPAWLRQSVLSQWLPLWLEQLQETEETNSMTSLLSMLLNANRVSAHAVLQFAAELPQLPQLWVSSPLLLDETLNLLHSGSEHGGK